MSMLEQHQQRVRVRVHVSQVEAFERNYALSATRMRQPYLMVRAQLISHMLDLTSRLGVTDEVVHDAVQIMDRAACEPNLVGGRVGGMGRGGGSG